MGQSVTGTQTGDGQTLLPQAVTQVLLLVTSHLRMHVFLCLSLFFMVRPLPKIVEVLEHCQDVPILSAQQK